MVVVMSVKKSWIQRELDQLQSSTIRVAILILIKRSDSENTGNPIHGYGLSEKLHIVTQGEIDVSNATFYSVLRQLKLENLVEQYEIDSDNRKYYRLTSDGYKACNKLLGMWEHYYNLITNNITKY